MSFCDSLVSVFILFFNYYDYTFLSTSFEQLFFYFFLFLVFFLDEQQLANIVPFVFLLSLLFIHSFISNYSVLLCTSFVIFCRLVHSFLRFSFSASDTSRNTEGRHVAPRQEGQFMTAEEDESALCLVAYWFLPVT